MTNHIYDLIIVGGGINGAGIARDAAERGLSVFLAEKHDFAFGTTFRSTKLIHGGLRYLEHYEIGLVRESLREREILLKIAPHLVEPIKFVLPIYEDSKYSYGKVKLGLMAYDMLSYDKSLENHKAFSHEEILEVEPHLRREHLRGGFVYFDCQVAFPERLCLENILMAKQLGADIRNYAEVTDFLRDDNRVLGVRVVDRLTDEESDVYGKVIINASGPWVDQVLGLNRGETNTNKMGGTKGSHILLPRNEHGPEHAIYVPAHQDGRPFFIIPYRDYYWVGTTDIRYNGDLDRVKATREEIDYLLQEVNFAFPEMEATHEDVFYCLAGIRPLPVTKSSTEEAEITRSHIIYDHEEEEEVDGLISIIGGKLTTYRNLAEETVDFVYKKMHREPPPCHTGVQPLWGGGIQNIRKYISDHAAEYAHKYRLEEGQVIYLISLYGTKFWKVLELIHNEPRLRERVCPNNPDIKAQIVFSVQNELSKTLADIYLRRTGIGTSACRGLDCAEIGAKVMGKVLKWRRRRIKQEVETYREETELLYGCG